MSRRALTLVVAILACGFVAGPTGTASADCVDTPVTITFDAGAGTPHCYTEGGVTVCASQGFPPGAPDDLLTLGDNDADTSPDLMNHAIPSDVLVYTFSMGGAPFAVTSFDYVDLGGGGYSTFDSSTDGYDFDEYGSGVVTPPDPEGWSGITSFTWAAYSFDPGPGAVMDNLSLVAQCCGNGVVDTGEQCDDGNTLGTVEDGNCCSATCQFEANGSYCTYDDNFCTADFCDGAGTCGHVDIPNCDLTRPCGPIRPPGNDAFEHPKKAGALKSDLVQAYVVCGDVDGNSPAGTTEGGVPSCSTETPNERAGNPTDGWQWDESKGRGYIQIKPICRGAADSAVKLKLIGVVDGNGASANTQGTLALTLYMTFDDPDGGGNMTAIPLVGEVPVNLVDGHGAITTTVGVMLTEAGMTDIPNGASLELVGIEVRDANGNAFARPGVFLP